MKECVDFFSGNDSGLQSSRRWSLKRVPQGECLTKGFRDNNVVKEVQLNKDLETQKEYNAGVKKHFLQNMFHFESYSCSSYIEMCSRVVFSTSIVPSSVFLFKDFVNTFHIMDVTILKSFPSTTFDCDNDLHILLLSLPKHTLSTCTTIYLKRKVFQLKQQKGRVTHHDQMICSLWQSVIDE